MRGSFVAIYIILMILLYMIAWPFKVITFTNLPFPVLNKPVMAGQIVVYRIDACKYREVPTHINRVLVGKVNIALNSQDSQQVGKGCGSTTVANTVIPIATPEGKYKVQITVEYKVNSLRTIIVHSETEVFDILPAKLDTNGNIIQSPITLPSSSVFVPTPAPNTDTPVITPVNAAQTPTQPPATQPSQNPSILDNIMNTLQHPPVISKLP